ncbi:MAG TPA: bifunctional oligoribonuclease/PAP phosphatase NrnA [Spirochaetota bacterium]|nr:bifunctional oligoribonuclease/PAP phosphatase NrnA [Spirochaetota bacterium]HOL56894.1 bifunctional oligoribonuclease/PAP phosphatase NrnA [Spirochaetota bacterium]HPP04476.1 bifunctional oligoribonuclease/PAP phosphatase NrnA [Spirochaetota bacterium]
MTDREIKNFQNFLKYSDNIIITGHENPDADSICSAIALEYLLSELGKNVICINSDPTPFNLQTFDYREVVKNLYDFEKILSFTKFNLIIVDTNDYTNIGRITSTILPKAERIFFIDHHRHKHENPDNSIFEENASSTCEIIFKLYEFYNIKIPKEIGDALYSGILFDSGSFHYPKTSSYTLNIAAKLIDNGTNPNEIYLLLFEQESIESLKILSKVLSTLELYHKEQIAILSLTREMLIETKAKYEEASDLINIPLKSYNIKAVIFFKEHPDGSKRVAMRSKGNVDVATIALAYDGGGHRNAAGFKLREPFNDFNDIKPILIENIKTLIDDAIW